MHPPSITKNSTPAAVSSPRCSTEDSRCISLSGRNTAAGVVRSSSQARARHSTIGPPEAGEKASSPETRSGFSAARRKTSAAEYA